MPPARGVEVRHLRAFVAVAEELHFGRAAQRLHMAQPPLSQLIRALENTLGTTLFERTSRSVRITPAGELMLDRARAILRDLDRAVEDVSGMNRGQSASVRFGFNDLCAIARVPEIAARFAHDNPDVQLQLRGTFYSADAVDMVHRGDLDAVLVHGQFARPGIASRVVGMDPLVAALPEGHHAAGRSSVRLEDLADEDWLTYPETPGSIMRHSLLAACANAGFRPRIVQGVDESMSQVALVAAGSGVAVLPASITPFKAPGAVYRALEGPPGEIALSICWRSDRDSGSVRKLVDTVIAAYAS